MAQAETPKARRAALEALERVGRGADVQAALDPLLDELPPRDTGLTTELTYGVLRLRARLDFLLDRHLRKPEKVPPPLRDLLRVAAFELTLLDRVPSYATVNWSVEATKQRFGDSLAGVVNGVLRNISRLGEDAAKPDYYRQDNPDSDVFLSRYHSMPLWVVRLWRKELGDEAAERVLAASCQAPPVGVRLNTRHPGAADLLPQLQNGSVFSLDKTAFALGETELDLPALEAEGRLTRQSAASQEAVLRLEPEDWSPPVWDACAGRGGKSWLLAERGVRPLWVSDLRPGRLKKLNSQAKRLGLPELPAFLADATQPPLGRQPRTILLDAPCSGLGVLARRPDAKWRRTPRDAKKLAGIQDKLLRAAWNTLPPGGELAYVTCTLNRAENEERVESLIRDKGAVEAVRFTTPPDSSLREFLFACLLRKP
ncbi:transcription antitermination factor NusB [Desulfohalovibrio reitneri]|uniref:transcription antitermination factor NusB n=1 Tax=Desulfohalovibrio reitneri TaxID=1307759 RepID=UPI0004A70177|nr:transcription antitermination factor NusB [Desulfohalovibrio reitneri]